MTRITIQDVAREAGVSVATVDRVLNRRAGVRSDTVKRVEAAADKLAYQPDRLAARLARARDYRFCFVLPTGTNTFMQSLHSEVEATAARLTAERIRISVRLVDVFDGLALAEELERLGEDFDGVAVVALDHPAVREAINGLADAGVKVVTLVSDAPGSKRVHYVGIDNTAAGRTAAMLLGRFVGPRKGKVGLIAGSLALRDHVERQFGFEQVMAREFPQLEVLPVREGRDDFEKVETVTAALLAETPDLVGIYNVGAGNRGIVAALEATERSGEVIFLAHDLTPFTRKHLVRGTIDAIVNQDPGHQARSAARVLLSACEDTPIVPDQERIRIDVFLRDNIP
ncbi:LacI family DNA-binding transcriptional regulator [Pelagibius litoralis]|uniref:LacI family DNA-binding transcriptional regulator n=1 Tax=Pelagibius litoralis TaxID=374515 RepID=UPI002AC33E2F|nr:LacI family DNA-binding transcriptional regulator [Pelagibius litoralis]